MNLYRGDGTIKAHYEYDSWGRMVSVTDENGNPITAKDNIGHVNPIRYRGYYYDTDTGLYYLKSRYYDPELGRFLNSDDEDVIAATPDALTDKNLFSYCDNNPIVRADDEGDFWNYIIGAVVGGVVGGVSAALSGGDWKSVLLGVGVGALGGTLAASGIPAGFQIAAGGLLNGAGNLANQTLVEGKSFKDVDWKDVAIDTAIGAGTSAISYGVTKGATKAAEKTINKGVNRVLSGKTSLERTKRYGKGAVKRGVNTMRSGIKQQNVARGKSSVIGSTSGGFLTSVKNFFKGLFGW